MKKKRKLRKRLIIALSSVLTVTIALVLFCVISGFNPISFIMGTKASGEDVVDDTNLQTITKPLPTDGSTAADYSAIENFQYFAYQLENSNFEATTQGVAKANYNGMDVSQKVYDYRKKVGEYSFTDTRSTSTFVKIYHEQFFTPSKTLYRLGDNSNYSKMEVQARSNKQEFNLYGYGPDKITGYIVCPETIVNTPEVIKNEDGTYTSTYELSPTVAPFYYQRKVKTNASISSYPKFSKIELTYTYTADWKLVKASYHEIYTIYKMKAWIETVGDITEEFNYLDEDVTFEQYDFYKDYFGLEVPADDEITEDTPYEMTALDYLGTMGSLITGKYLNLDVDLLINGKKYNTNIIVNLINYNVQIKLNDVYYVYKDDKLYIKGDKANYIDINELTPILSIINLLKMDGNTPSKPESSNLNTEELIAGIMSDINSGTVNKDNGKTYVNVLFHFGQIAIPVVFNFNTPNEETVEFTNLEASYNYKNYNMDLDVKISNNGESFLKIDDSYEKLDLALNGDINFDLIIKNATYKVSGNIYVDALNLSSVINGSIMMDGIAYNINITILNNTVYINVLDNIYFKVTFEELIGMISSVNIDTNSQNNISLNSIKEYLNMIVVENNNGLTITLDELNINDVILSKINISLTNTNYKNITISDVNYLTLDDVLPIIETISSMNFDKLSLNGSLNLVYKNNNVLVDFNYYNHNKSLKANILYKGLNIGVIYLDNNLYLSINGKNVYLSLEDYKGLINGNEMSNLNNETYMVLSLLASLKIIPLEDSIYIELLDNYNLNLKANNNVITLSTNNIIYKDIIINNILVNILEDDTLISLNKEYVKLGSILEGQINTNLLYQNLAFNLNGSYYFNILDMEGILTGNLIYDTNNIDINIVFKNNAIYINMLGTKLYLNLADINLISNNKSSMDLSILISLLNSININTTDVLKVSLDDLTINDLSINDTYITIKEALYKEVSINEEIYENDLSSLLTLLNNSLPIVEDIISNKKASLNVNLETLGYQIRANIDIFFKSGIVLDAEVFINDELVNVIYENDIAYITYRNINLYMSKDDITNIINKYLPSDSLSSNIISKDSLNNIDYNKLLENLVFSENSVSYMINDICLLIDVNDSININLSKYNTNISIMTNNKELPVIDYEKYYNLNSVVEFGEAFYNIINNKCLTIEINSLNIASLNISINGNINLYFDNEFRMNAILDITYNGYNIDANIMCVNNMVYITISEQTLVIDINNLNSFKDELLIKLEEIFGITINMNSNTNKVNNNEIIQILDSLLITDELISVSLDSLVNEVLLITVIYGVIDNNISVSGEIDYSNINVDLDLLVKECAYEDFIVPTTNLISTDDILILLDNIDALMSLMDEKKFNIGIQTTINENGKDTATISGNVYIELLNNNKFNLYLDLIVVEYNSNNTKKAWHHLTLSLIMNDDLTSGMLYATYGNNENDQNAVINCYSTYSGVKDLINSILEIMNIGIINDLTSGSMSVTYLDINNLINMISISNESIFIELDQKAFNEKMFDTEILELSITRDDSGIRVIELNNLVASYTNERIYTKIMNTSISINDASSISFSAPSSLDGYIDISNMSNIFESLYNNALEKQFEISGNVSLKAIGINAVTIPVTIKVLVDDSGKPMIHANIDMTSLSLIAQILASKKNIDIYYVDNYVYIHRKDNNGDEYKCKIHYKTFMDDILYYLLDYSMGLSQSIIDQINNASSNGDGFVDAALCVNSATFGTNTMSLNLNLGEIADNASLDNMEVTINSSDVLVNRDGNDEYVKMFTNISKFKLGFINNILVLTSSSLSVSNIRDNGSGYLVVNDIDMSKYYSYIEDFDSKYLSDIYYEGSGDSFSAVGNLTHSVTLNYGGYIQSEVRHYLSGERIELPTFENDLIETIVDGQTKYYRFMGWYYDKSYQNPINETLVMNNSKLYYYARLVDITANITIESEYYDTYSLTVYEGYDITSIINNKYEAVNTTNGIYVFKNLLLNDSIFDMTNVLKGNYTLNAIFEFIEYDFVLIYKGNSYILSGNTSSEAIIDDLGYVIENNILFEFSKEVLTPTYLITNYISYFVKNDVNKTFEFELLSINDIDFDRYNKISYSVLENYNNKDYEAFYLLKDMSYDITSYLPNGSYESYEINAWYGEKYYALNELVNVSEALTLNALIATKQEYFTFEFVDETNTYATISGYTGTQATVILPRYALINNNYYVVTNIKISSESGDNTSAFTSNDTIVTIVLNDGLTSLGTNAFKDCASLVNVYFSNSVTSVQSDAFYMQKLSSYEKNRDVAIARRFYFTDNSIIKEKTLQSWLAAKWNLNKKYYEKSYSIAGTGDFRNAYQTYNTSIIEVINTLLV